MMEVQGFTFVNGLIMLALDGVLLAFFGFYLDQVLPKEYGVAKPWNFICKRCTDSKHEALKKRLKLGEEVQDMERVRKGNFEEVASQSKHDSFALKVRNLRKEFQNGKVAIGNVSMTMYSGQIFALLGHNGAGKTTTISTLTGLLMPTNG